MKHKTKTQIQGINFSIMLRRNGTKTDLKKMSDGIKIYDCSDVTREFMDDLACGIQDDVGCGIPQLWI
jgi:hypothetical protein